MEQNEKQGAEALPKDGAGLVERLAAPAGVAEVLQLLAYCNRIQAAFPTIPHVGTRWITNSSHTI
jgi:hypothetical protein